MIRSHSLLALGSVALLAAGCGGGGEAPQQPVATAQALAAAAPVAEADAGITARAMLAAALAEARKWQADAELIGVTTSLAEGPANFAWFYDVQSRAAGSCTRIRALAKGKVENVGPGDACNLMQPVAESFVDSPAAWEAARAAGFRPGDTVQFGLRFQRDEALSAPRECWVLWSDAEADEAAGVINGWCVNPANGEFVARLSGRGRIEPLQP